MDSTDSQVKVREKTLQGKNRPVRLGGSTLGHRAHVCAFFNNSDDEYRILLPFIKDGFACGEKAFHTINPQRRNEHLQRLALAGIDVTAIRRSGQLELCDWTDTHLRNGQFDQSRTLALYKRVRKDAAQQGFPLVRFITHMEWALETDLEVDALLEYEARANETWLHHDGLVHPVICTYDLTRFSGEVVVDVMRTHPMIIIGGILQENPFFVPPDEFLRERRERRAA